MSLLKTYHHFLCWSDTQILLFCLKYESYFGRNDMVLTMRGLKLLPVALPIILIHLRKVMKHSSSNVCLCLQHTITSPLLIQCWSICYSAETTLRVFCQQKWHSIDHRGLGYAVRSSSNHHHTSKEGYDIYKQQCMSLLAAQHPNPRVERVLQIWYFV